MELKLPLSITSRIDIARVMRELHSLDDFLVQAAVRATGQPMQLPKLSRQLEEVTSVNQFSLLDESNRKELYAKLNTMLSKCPQLHISFAAEPSPKAMARILLWLRESIHPQILVVVGLQPTIAVGCAVRTPNLFFDLSMRQYLAQQEPYLAQLIKEAARSAG